MKFNKILYKLNRLYSFNLFSITGWIFLFTCLTINIPHDKIYGLTVILMLIIPLLVLTSIVIALIEYAFSIRIKNHYFITNNILTVIRVLGAIFGIFYEIQSFPYFVIFCFL